MSFHFIEIERTPGVATLWLNRPETHNAFNAGMIAELIAALRDLGADDAIRAVVLAGRGRSFCAGGDLAWMKAAGEADVETNLADARALAVLLRTLAELPKPTLARVHGAALGGGMGLAAACDICVASTDAVFATTETRLGLIPAVISPYVLRAIGARHALRFFQTGERLSAAEAHRLGLAHEAVETGRLDATIAEILEALLQGGPQALAATKALVRDIAGRPVDDALVEETARRIATTRAGEEAREGLAAFLEKRRSAWRL
jgi:methylglutaconyl-CoA hydratase